MRCTCADCTRLRSQGIPVEDEATARYVHTVCGAPRWWQLIVLPLIVLHAAANMSR